MLLRSVRRVPVFGVRRMALQTPFQDDLTQADNDDFGLSDFQHYKKAPDVLKAEAKFLEPLSAQPDKTVETKVSLEEIATLEQPVVVVSKLSSPFRNLAIEDFLFSKMPTQDGCNRLVFYTNSPCVVIGKNQNPWKEVNMPLLNSLDIPLVRRRSGGGTVVHDLGNVNYSFMTTKAKFDRFAFAHLVRDAVNSLPYRKFDLAVNDRGDITTTQQPDGISYKVSGSAYKLARGRSYHHGTMLLNLRLDILGQLLSWEPRLGVVDALNSVSSVKSKVTNLGLSNDEFIAAVTRAFEQAYGLRQPTEVAGDTDYDHNELFGLTDFVEAFPSATTVVVDENMELPQHVHDVEAELRLWDWQYGGTPKFTHELYNDQFGFTIKFHVDRKAVVSKYELTFDDVPRLLLEPAIRESFEFVDLMISRGALRYKGSEIAGFITNDVVSEWVGTSIDGTS